MKHTVVEILNYSGTDAQMQDHVNYIIRGQEGLGRTVQDVKIASNFLVLVFTWEVINNERQ